MSYHEREHIPPGHRKEGAAAWPVVAIAAIIAFGAALGGAYGTHIGSAAAASQRDAVEAQVQDLQSVLQVVGQHYAEEPDPAGLIYEGAVPSMLRRLDPHSMFFDPAAFARLREEQRGSYAGVGMLIRPYFDETIVDYPFPGTPAFEAGVRPGDAIVEVDGSSTVGLNVEEVAQLVRGPEGTSVHLTLRRQATDDFVQVDVIRANIPRPSVLLSFFVAPGVGYVRIGSFNETTGDEVDEALSVLEDGTLQGLVLDLRDNQGGLLTGGVRVADHFLKRGQTIVSHRGRASEERVYKARHGQEEQPYPMIVLVNCSSASAAEIVAGALQDHDRALIVGSHTFGKGLVQSVFELSDSTGLVLTTARYYTPSGRLIQRPYDNVSQRDYYANPCSPNYEPVNLEPRLTDSGRAVYSGAGIAPDVKLPEIVLNSFQQRLQERRAFEGYAQAFGLKTKVLPSVWEPDSATIAQFRQYLEQHDIAFDPQEFQGNMPYIRRLLKKNIYTAVLNYDEGMRADTELDPSVRRAIELLPEARALLDGRTGSLAQQR